MSSRPERRSGREIVGFVLCLIGFGLILGDRENRLSPSWGWLAGTLVCFGLLELLVDLRAVRRTGWSVRTCLEALAGVGLVAAGIAIADSWRWVLAGAWPVGVVVLMTIVWPVPRSTTVDG